MGPLLLLAVTVGLDAEVFAAGVADTAVDAEGAEDTPAGIVRSLHDLDLWAREVGRLAVAAAEEEQVRTYGRVILRDHRPIGALVEAYAAREGIAVPPVSGEPSPAGVGLAELRVLAGATFDRALLTLVLQEYGRATRALRRAHAVAEDPRLRGLLARVVPVLEQHEALAAVLLARLDREGPPWRRE